MKRCFLTIYDQKNEPYAKIMKRSLQRFHPDIPLVEITEKELATCGIPKPHIFYIATPFFTQRVMNEYDEVIKIDADSIISHDLSHVWEMPFYDIGTVYNYSRSDVKTYGPVAVWDIAPQVYYNNGFVVMRSKEMVDHWLTLCQKPNIINYKMREQDLLNIICHYGNYRVQCLDESPYWHGLTARGEWNKCVMKDGNIVLPSTPDKYPRNDQIISVIHWAGGESQVKMNYKSYFTEDVSSYLDTLTHE